jgi:FkbM family methyltransferase
VTLLTEPETPTSSPRATARQHVKLGNAKSKSDPDAAIAAYAAARAADPAYVPGWLNAGRLLLRRGDRAGAVPLLEQAVALAPESADIQNTMARLLFSAGRHDEAIRAAERACSLDPDSKDFQKLRRRLARRAGAEEPRNPPQKSEESAEPILHVATFNRSGREYSFVHTDAEDHIFRVIQQSGNFYEASLLNQLSRLLKPGDVVIDAGANIGNHAVYFAGVCSCEVICFEPNPRAAELLRLNIESNGVSGRVTIYEKALGERAASVRMDESNTLHNLGSARVVAENNGSIALVSLDDFLPRARPRLIKIDTEGMEAPVLLGAREIIRKHRPAICVEVADIGRYDEITDFLDQFGYIHIGSYNFTPTHIFVPFRWWNIFEYLKLLARQNGRNHVQSYKYHSDLLSRLHERQAAKKPLK